MHKVVRNIPRADAAVIKELGTQGVATVHEAQARTGLMAPYMRPIYPSAKMAGSAVTALCAPGDNMMIHAAVEVCKPGDVLVVVSPSDYPAVLEQLDQAGGATPAFRFDLARKAFAHTGAYDTAIASTLGEVSDALRGVFGEYRPTV